MWGGLSGATPAEAVSWGKVNPGVLPDTVVAYCDSTIAFPLFCEYAVGSENGRRRAQGTRAQARRARRRSAAAGEGRPEGDHGAIDVGAGGDRSASVESRFFGVLRGSPGSTRFVRGSTRFYQRSAGFCRVRSSKTFNGHPVVRAEPASRAVSHQPRIYADANMPSGVVAFMREQLRVGRAVRARARRPAARARHRALPARAAARAGRSSRSIATTSTTATSRRPRERA